MNKFRLPASFKAEANGTFSGVANMANVVDLGGDRAMPGAFTSTLARKNRLPLLWSHRVEEPLGEVELVETYRGLEVRKGTFVLSVQRAAEIYALLKEAPAAIGGMSIGYTTVREKFVRGVRELHEIECHEISLVVMPMNPASVVETVKGSTDLEHLSATLSSMKRSLTGDSDDDRLLAETCERIQKEMRAMRFARQQRFY